MEVGSTTNTGHQGTSTAPRTSIGNGSVGVSAATRQAETALTAQAVQGVQDTHNITRTAAVEKRLEQALSELELPTDSFRMELNYSKDTGRVVARVLDKDSGEVLRELPSKELQRLFSQMREFLGSVVDEEA